MSSVLIKELGRVTTGNTPSKNNSEFYSSNDIGFIKPDVICDEKLTYIKSANEFISQKARSKARIVKNDAVLVTCIGSIGKICIVKDGEFAFNQQINAIEPNEKVSAEYLAYCLLYNKNRLIHIANAPVVPIINKTQFENFQLNIIDNREKQNEIVEVLNRLNRVLDMCEKQMGKYDVLIQSRFMEMFGDPVDNPKKWTKRQLQEIVTDDCTISYGIVQTGDNKEDGIPVIRPIDIVNRKPKLEELKKTTLEISNKYKKTLLRGREMLITVRANIADTCIIGEEFKGCNVGRGIVPIRTQENIIILEFLKFQLDNKHLNDNIKKLAKGITLLQLNMEDLRRVKLITPPIDRQRIFVEFAKRVDKLKAIEQKRLEKLHLLFDSLMQKYFGQK